MHIATETKMPYFTIDKNDGSPLVKIDLNSGNVTIFSDTDEAAKGFWDALQKYVFESKDTVVEDFRKKENAILRKERNEARELVRLVVGARTGTELEDAADECERVAKKWGSE